MNLLLEAVAEKIPFDKESTSRVRFVEVVDHRISREITADDSLSSLNDQQILYAEVRVF